MAPKNETNFCQEDFFYDAQWGRRVDDAFIEFLESEARLGKFVWPNKTADSLMVAGDRICMQFNENFTLYYCITRLDVLEQRFFTFKWMLSLDGVVYDPNANVVTAPDHLWNVMCETNTFVNAYLMKGEAKYEQLSVIFVPAPIEVVNVSSDDEVADEGVFDQNGKRVRGKGKATLTVGQSTNNPFSGCLELVKNRGNGSAVAAPRPPLPASRNVNLHLFAVPDNSIQTPPFNIWEYLKYFSDTESGATDISTANSYNYGARGQRSDLDRKKKSSGHRTKCRISATDSCSPLPKEKR